MSLSPWAASVVAVIMKCRKKDEKIGKRGLENGLKTGPSSEHTTLSWQSSETHINTFSKFHSNTAVVSVATLDLSTKPRDTKLENDWWTSFNKRQLVERIEASSILFNNAQLAYFNIQQYMIHCSTLVGYIGCSTNVEPCIIGLSNIRCCCRRKLLRSRYENATPNLCWVFCALLGVLCN